MPLFHLSQWWRCPKLVGQLQLSEKMQIWKYTEQKWKRYTPIIYFLEKVLDKKYLLKLNDVANTSSKRFVETSPVCLVWCMRYAPLSV